MCGRVVQSSGPLRLAIAAWRAAENCRESQLHTEFRRATASVSRLAHRPQHRHGAG